MKIQRYDVEGPETQHECCPGRYVRFEDHEKIVGELSEWLRCYAEAFEVEGFVHSAKEIRGKLKKHDL